MPKRLLIVAGSNDMVDTDLEAFVYLIRDEWETVAFDRTTMDAKCAADYDAVLLSHAVHKDEPVAAIVDAARPGRLFMHACDIQFTNRAPMGANRKPLTLIASLAPSIVGTPEGDALAKAWLAPLHPASRVVFSEFLVGLIYTKAPDIEAAAEAARDADAPDIRAFYWGIKRPGVVESLRTLGFGTDKRDALFGSISTKFRGVRDLTAEPRLDMATWAPHVVHAEQVLLPYEPVKSEYQITRRLLECAYLAPGRTVSDPRISEHVHRFLDPDEWTVYAKQVSEELLNILDEGLAVDSAGEYGQQVGFKHGDLLAWILANVDFADGWAVEFGTGDGTSTRTIAKRMSVMTFDCLTGLPEKWRDGFDRGAFKQRRIPNVPGSIFVNGLFADTLPTAPLPDKVALLHIDCDLYSSTATVFERAKDLIQVDTVIVFDELINYPGYEQHELKAWNELLAAWSTLKVEPIAWAHEAVAFRVTAA